jgi:hypothetical protein
MAVSKQWQLMRSWLRKTYNKEVHEFFKDYPDADPDNTSSLSTTKAVCLIGAKDSQGIAQQKQQNFDRLRERSGLKLENNHNYDYLIEESLRSKPQVQLWFKEKKSAAYQDGRNWIKAARFSFRIKEDWRSSNDANATALKIKNHLVNPLFHFTSGSKCASYIDPKKGYKFTLYIPDEAEAKKTIGKVFDIMEDTPNWKKLRISDFVEEKTTTTVQVLGKTVRQFPLNKTTEVYFRYAIAKIDPYPRAFPLVDVSGKYVNAIYRAD